EPGDSVMVEAMAENSSGTIEKVEFYVDEEKAGVAGEPPYHFSWFPSSRGRYTLRTRAYSSPGSFNPSEPVYVSVYDGPGPNLIINPEFGYGTEAWKLDIKKPWSAVFDIDEESPLSGNHSARVRVENGGSSLGNISLQQRLYLEQGKSYRLSLRTRSSVGRKALLSVSSQEDRYMYNQSVLNLNTEENTITSEFVCNRTDYLGLLELFLGGVAAEVLVDSVYLVEQGAAGLTGDHRTTGIVLYPNPCHDWLILEFGEEVTGYPGWRILDMTGRCLASGNGKGTPLRIDTRALEPGAYVLMTGTIQESGARMYFIKH
ncbi:MAG: hypothetical protein EHM46_05940, partial [Bacteroidetes bacterium]